MVVIAVVGGIAVMWGLRRMALAIARHGDARVADEARAWLDRQSGP